MISSNLATLFIKYCHRWSSFYNLPASILAVTIASTVFFDQQTCITHHATCTTHLAPRTLMFISPRLTSLSHSRKTLCTSLNLSPSWTSTDKMQKQSLVQNNFPPRIVNLFHSYLRNFQFKIKNSFSNDLMNDGAVYVQFFSYFLFPPVALCRKT